jgi:phosphoserine phosphatase RsbU/P
MNSLIKIWHENKVKIITVFSILLVILALINLFFIFEVTAQSNDECIWQPKKSSSNPNFVDLKFRLIKENGVTWNAGIRDGDLLLAIDGVKATNLQLMSFTLDKVRSGDYATYLVSRNERIFETRVLVKKLINIQGFGFWLLAFIWLLVGYVAVLAKPEGRTQTAFYIIGALLILFTSNNFLYRGNGADNPILTSRILLIGVFSAYTIGACFLPFTIFKFFSLFPKPFVFTEKNWFKIWLNIIPIILTVLSLIAVVVGFINRAGDSYFNRYFTIMVSLAVLGFVAGLILLIINYRRLVEKREKVAIRIILITYAIGVASLIYNFFIVGQITASFFNDPFYFTPIILIALLPVAFGYSIFRYSLLDMREVLKVTILYGSASLTLAAIYFILIYVVGQGISSAFNEEYRGILAGVVFVIFAVGFQSTKNRFQYLITQKFYPEQFAFQEMLVKYSSDVSSIVGLDNIVEWTRNAFVNSLRLEHFGIMISTSKGDGFRLISSHGFTNTECCIDDEWCKVNEFVIKQLLSERINVIENQDFVQVFGEESKKLEEENIYTVIPLVIKSKVIGLLLFGLKKSGTKFAGRDLELLVSAANQTAVTFENARLYKSEIEKQYLERDLDNARKVQESLLPKSIPSIKGLCISGRMIPAQHVGGDYYDVIKVNEDEVFAVVGDVSGKGLSAALYMSKLQTMIRLYCTDGKSPKEILVEVNKRISAEMDRNHFVTVGLALFNLKTHSVILCRAGHLPFILLRDSKVEIIQPSGIGIGLDRKEVFPPSLIEEEISLQKDDVLLLLSDGVTESMNTNTDMYGMERLTKLLLDNSNLDCEDLQSRIIKDVNDFSNGVPQHDDLTLLLIKYLT